MKLKLPIFLNYILVLIFLNCTANLYKYQNYQNISKNRKILYLTKEEKDFVLYEMRELLKAIHGIHTGIANDDYNFAYKIAKSAGMDMVHKIETKEKIILLKLPNEFKKLGFSTHNQFDLLAESIKEKDKKEIEKNLSILTSYCVSCHDLYSFEVENK